MSAETRALADKVKNDPQFHELVRRRARLAWSLSALMMAIYFGFVLTIAFDRELLGRSLDGGVTTIGIPVGIGVIVSAFVLTGIYVARAGSAFDALTKELIERAKS